MKQLRIRKIPNYSKQFDTFKHLKKVLKPIKTDSKGLFLKKLMNHPYLLLQMFHKEFSLSDHSFVDMKCDVFYNINIIATAQIGNGANCYLHYISKDNDPFEGHISNEKELLEELNSFEFIPERIAPIKIVLAQNILNTRSNFIYQFDEKNDENMLFTI